MTDKPKAGRPAKWSGPTTAIRVPEHLAPHLIAIARQLDTPQAAEPSTTPEGLPICKPQADAETIAQGLAEGRVFEGLTETERVFLLGRLVEELGEPVPA